MKRCWFDRPVTMALVQVPTLTNAPSGATEAKPSGWKTGGFAVFDLPAFRFRTTRSPSCRLTVSISGQNADCAPEKKPKSSRAPSSAETH